MKIILYNTKSENNKINKSLTNKKEFTGNLRQQSGVINPVVTIEAENLSQYNYLYIEEWKRYYFIKEATCIRENMWQLSCDVDVLMSFRNDILNLNAIVDKSQNAGVYNKYINDPDGYAAMIENRRYNHVIQFPSVDASGTGLGFNDNKDDTDWNIVMLVSGSASNITGGE